MEASNIEIGSVWKFINSYVPNSVDFGLIPQLQ